MTDADLLDRALGILHRMATEQTGWRRVLARWYYSDEPLRNDAANLVREAGFGTLMPLGTQLVGERPEYEPTLTITVRRGRLSERIAGAWGMLFCSW